MCWSSSSTTTDTFTSVWMAAPAWSRDKLVLMTDILYLTCLHAWREKKDAGSYSLCLYPPPGPHGALQRRSTYLLLHLIDSQWRCRGESDRGRHCGVLRQRLEPHHGCSGSGPVPPHRPDPRRSHLQVTLIFVLLTAS